MTSPERKRAEAMARALYSVVEGLDAMWDEEAPPPPPSNVAEAASLAAALDVYFAHTRFNRGMSSYRFKPEPIDE